MSDIENFLNGFAKKPTIDRPEYWQMVHIKHFKAPQKMPNFQFSRPGNWP